MTLEEEAHADTLEILQELGSKFTITRTLAKSVNAATLRPTEEIEIFEALGVFYDPAANAIKSGWEQSVGEDYRADLKYIIIKPTGDDEMKRGDICQSIGKDSGLPEGRPVIVMSVNPVGPWGAPIFYRVAAE